MSGTYRLKIDNGGIDGAYRSGRENAFYLNLEIAKAFNLIMPRQTLCAQKQIKTTRNLPKGKDCVPDFIQWVHSLASQEDVEKVIIVAHNFKGYDGYFILDEFYKPHATNLNQIVNGAKILSLELPNIKFIDSMNFFPMALSNFPKTFGLNEMKKGFFPHFFNTQQNQIYEG